MCKRNRFCASLVGLSMLVPGYAESVTGNPAASEPREVMVSTFRIPTTDYEVVFNGGAAPRRGVKPPLPMLDAVVTWLSNHFDLPRNGALPKIQLEPATKITTFRYTGLLSDNPRDMADVPPRQREVVAAYNSLAKIIYLPQGWTGSTPVELSILVHEMVHHLQNVAGIRYECPQASEALAYEAQNQWLRLFGRDLATDFDVDPFTLTVVTQCFY